MGDRLTSVLAGLAVAVGVAVALAGASVLFDAWRASQAWAGSGDAYQAELPVEPPLWLDGQPAGAVTSRPDFTPRPALRHGEEAADRVARRPNGDGERAGGRPGSPARAVGEGTGDALPHGDAAGGEAGHPGARADDSGEATSGPPASRPTQEADAATGELTLPRTTETAMAGAGAPAVSPAEIALAEVEFRFLDPPEPGAHARLAVTLQSQAAQPSGPFTVALPTRWLESFEVFGAIPDVLDDRAAGAGERRFVFPGLDPGERQTVELHLRATGEEIDAPEVRVVLGGEPAATAEIGRARPRTVAPRPRPGPVRAIAIPKLGVRAAVVPVAWEPPPFVVGQLHGSAAVSLGNTVLIGHLAGPQGDVFARLDRLRPGDEVVAVSRGLEYRFMVSEVAVRPYDDVQPTEPTETPRLTLMTCTGQWSVVRQDYSHRLWVVAEPPELAAQTIRANAARAAEAAREAEAAAAARAGHEAELASAPPPPAEPAPPATPPAARSGGAGSAPSAAAPPTAERATPQADLGRHPEVDAVSIEAGAAAAAPAAPMESDLSAAEQPVPGVVVEAPADRAIVASRLTVRGRRTADAPPGAPLWLAVRADVEGGRWYVLDRPVAPAKDGSWQVEIVLGGTAGLRHEIRVGVVDPADDDALRRHAAERPGQPLDDLPPSFRTGARVVVERR